MRSRINPGTPPWQTRGRNRTRNSGNITVFNVLIIYLLEKDHEGVYPLRLEIYNHFIRKNIEKWGEALSAAGGIYEKRLGEFARQGQGRSRAFFL
jgi:hypothetical protein